MGIGRKLTLLVAVPPLGLVAASGVPVSSAAEQAGQAEQTRLVVVVVVASRARQLAAAQEQERVAAVGVLTDGTSVAALTGYLVRIAKTDSAVADEVRAVSALAQAAADDSEQLVAVLRAVRDPQLTPPAAQEIIAARTGFDEQIQSVSTAGGPAWAAQAQRTLFGPQILTGQQLQGAVTRTAAGDRLRVKRQVWTAAVDARVARLHEVSQSFDAPSGAAGRTRRLAVVDA